MYAGFQMGVSYAYSKYMDFTGIPQYANLRTYAYGLTPSTRRICMTFNYTYNIPESHKLVKNKLIGYAFDQLGALRHQPVCQRNAGAISFTTTNSENLNGGGDAQRVDVIGNAFSGNIHTFDQWFNTAAFALPGMNDPGNAGKVRCPAARCEQQRYGARQELPDQEREALLSRFGGKPTTSSITPSTPASTRPPSSRRKGSRPTRFSGKWSRLVRRE